MSLRAKAALLGGLSFIVVGLGAFWSVVGADIAILFLGTAGAAAAPPAKSEMGDFPGIRYSFRKSADR